MKLPRLAIRVTAVNLIARWLLCVALVTAFASGRDAGATPLELIERHAAFYPEGLSRIERDFWFGEMSANRVSRWRDGQVRSFAAPSGCGPTSVERYDRYLLVLCHSNHRILLMDTQGRVVHEQSRSVDARPLRRPNDAVRDDHGGIYFSSSGEFASEAPRAGQVFYLRADGRITRVAGNIHYANGVEFDRANRRLLVSAHLAHRILAFEVRSPGELGPVSVLHDLSGLLAPYADWRVGPDGLHLDPDGTLRIAIYGAGRVLVLDGTERRWIDVPTRFVTTVLNDARTGLFVGGTFDLSDWRLRGELMRYRPGAGVLGQ